MLVARRIFAVILGVPLLALLAAATVFGAAGATILNGDFLADAMEDTDFQARVHGEGLPTLIREVTERQDERLPENLRGLNLPSDDASVARMTEVVQTMFPEALVQAQTDEFLREFVPWITGRTDSFEWRVDLHGPLIATFGPRGSEPGLFQAAWLDLDMSHRMLQGLSERQQRERAEAGGAAPEEPSVLDRLGPNLPAAEDWLDDAVLEIVDSMVPYLAGDTEDFDIHLDFTPYPELAEPLADVLRSDEATLLAEGWRFNSADFRQRLDDSGNPTVNDPDDTVAMFRPGGITLTSDDFVQRMEEQREANRLAGEPNDGPTIEEVRSAMRWARFSGSWLTIGLALLVATGIAFLGGRTWQARALWGGGAFALAAALVLGSTTAVYAATVEGRVDEWVAEERVAVDPDVPVALRDPVLDLVVEVTHGVSAAMTWRAAAWLILGLLVVAAALLWPRLRPATAATAPAAPSAAAPPEAPPLAEPSDTPRE
ncbi:MAG: hypothetical protein AMXMBFR23_25560 [Chloroflexota bacterium]